MRLALHINDYAGLGGTRSLAGALGTVARTAEEAGFSRLSVTDHLWQISLIGEHEEPMLEAYTTLGFLAGQTRTIELQTLVTAATYRPPGLLAKIVTTLDVLSQGRAWLGIGAGWNEEEATGLGLPFAHQAERFARLEETLRICAQMWSADDGPFVGEHYQLAGTLNSPQPLSRPRVLVGGGGERTTLRLAAKYADAFNVYGGPDAGQKIRRLHEHCAKLGRDPSEIELTAVLPLAGHSGGEQELLGRLRELHDLGFTTVYTALPAEDALTSLENAGAKAAAEAAQW